jgi:DNA (cytosine-5)-methyltransferase 1
MKPLRFVSLFSGAGGMDIGFEQAGWECAYASDVADDCVETLKLNTGRKLGGVSALANCFVEQADVRTLQGQEILAKAGLSRGDLVTLVGGPPCQSWSSAGRQLGFDDPRGQLLRDYVRLAAELDARWLVFENVRGLLTARGPDGEPGSALHAVRQALLEAGFQTEVNLLNAADFGVPQRRVRLFMIGFRHGDRPTFPRTTHTKEADLFRDAIRPWKSLKEGLARIALSDDDIIRPSASLLTLLSSVPEGSGLKSPGKKESTRPGGHWGYKQGCFVSDPSLPARTVTASTQQDWIRDSERGLRRLSPKECAALQSFPSSWRFVGTRSSIYKQIGNAVPPTLAKAIAVELHSHVAAARAFRQGAVTKAALSPLDAALLSAIEYTKRDEMRNGESRRLGGSKQSRRRG